MITDNRTRRRAIGIVVLVLTICLAGPFGPAWAAEPPLVLESTLPLPAVAGRIDHMAVDLKRNRLIVAELGNGTVEVIDLGAGKVVHRLTGLQQPQGVGYAEKGDLVLVADAGDGQLRMFQAEDLAPAGSISLGDDADNVRVDPRNGMVVVGYGSGGLAVIDPVSRSKVADIALPAHPEGFQIDPASGLAFVNVPDAGQIVVVDLGSRRVSSSLKLTGARANFPMALDRGSDLLAVVFRSPPRLAIISRDRLTVQDEVMTCRDADDVFFDGRRSRIYVSCGGGEVAVFQSEDGKYRLSASVTTAPGARTSLFVPELDRLFVAARAGAGSEAAILNFRPRP